MSNAISSSLLDDPYIDRHVLSYVEVIERKYPEVNVIARGPDYSDLRFTSSVDKVILTEELLFPLLIECTMVDWIHVLFTEANQLQEFAATYFTFANRGTNQIQVTMYEQKYIKSKEYIFSIETFLGNLVEAKSAIPVPTMLENEASILNEDPYELAKAVIANYMNSNELMTAYYGLIEGERRLAKRRILACKSITELLSLQWATWPAFIPPTENMGD